MDLIDEGKGMDCVDKVGYKAPPLELFCDDAPEEYGFADKEELVKKLTASFERLKINARIAYVSNGVNVSAYVFELLGVSAFKAIKERLDVISYDSGVGGIRVTEFSREYERGIMSGTKAYNGFLDGRGGQPFMKIRELRHYAALEIPSEEHRAVRLKSVFSTPSFAQAKPPCLMFPLGKNLDGETEFVSLEDMPHLLVAGTTGSGKSIFINSMIAGLILKNSPRDLRLVLIDFMRVEFSVYAELPHNLTKRPIYDNERAMNALKWAVGEMNRRFETLVKARAMNIKDYNASAGVAEGRAEKLPRIVIIIDEICPFMVSHKKETEALIITLSQKGRAAGIHLVIATQRPSVEVLSGLIRANIPARIAFRTSTFIDSRTIIGTSGAEMLIGKGDILFVSPSVTEPKRIQGCGISGMEISNIVEFVKKNNPSEYSLEIENAILD